MNDAYDYQNHRGTDRRAVLPWFVRYWQILVSAALIAAGAASFYFSTVALAKEVTQIRADHILFPQIYTTRTDMGYEMRYLEREIEDIEVEAGKHETEDAEEYRKLNAKIDKVLDHLIKNDGGV